MLNTFRLIQELKKQGISVSLFQGHLKVEPKALITDSIRGQIKANRQAFIEALNKPQPSDNELPPSREKQQMGTPTQGADGKRPVKGKTKPSPVAVSWLLDHKKQLLEKGWTLSELFDRRKYRRGIAWLDLWDEAFSRAYLHESGEIEFELSRHGRDYFQTARPRSIALMKQTEVISDFKNQF